MERASVGLERPPPQPASDWRGHTLVLGGGLYQLRQARHALSLLTLALTDSGASVWGAAPGVGIVGLAAAGPGGRVVVEPGRAGILSPVSDEPILRFAQTYGRLLVDGLITIEEFEDEGGSSSTTADRKVGSATMILDGDARGAVEN